MCGICGQYYYKHNQNVNPDILKMMTNSIQRRGPDDEGLFIEKSLGFGFRRLSIIDLSGGHQPMLDKEKTVCVIFNGEIYNFPELKKELEGYGHCFQTKSDTEVIIHGYKQWGKGFLEHLNGMFGLALWDIKNKFFMLARDPMGIKFIYYHMDEEKIYFGSEIRPIKCAIKEPPSINPNAVYQFLRFRYTPSPLTIYNGISKLAAGTRLVCEFGKKPVVERWYEYRPVPFEKMPSKSEAREELLSIYKRAMKRHLLSDVPVGLLLSGGMDSALLLSLMNEYGKNWKTYTVGYGTSYTDDELLDASKTVEMFNADHSEVLLTVRDFEETLTTAISVIEEPIASSSIVPMYHVCKLARMGVKVALMGQGPDELFGGYQRHYGIRYGYLWRNLPKQMRSFFSLFLNMVPRNEKIRRSLYSLDIQERMLRYMQVFSIMKGDVIDSLFIDGIFTEKPELKMLESWKDMEHLLSSTDELGGFQFIEMRSSLPDELLLYADKLSMHHSLEIRVPYLDREIVEYVERLNQSYKIKNFTRKWLHREVCKNYLPSSIIKRKKRGFAVNVVDDWFRNSLSSKMDQTLKDNQSLIYSMIQPKVVENLLLEHKKGINNNHKILFSLMVLEQFLQQNNVHFS
jgi:asparagine synthase (glutamine-hydrolysing)